MYISCYAKIQIWLLCFKESQINPLIVKSDSKLSSISILVKIDIRKDIITLLKLIWDDIITL